MYLLPCTEIPLFRNLCGNCLVRGLWSEHKEFSELLTGPPVMETHATTTNTFLLLSGCVCYIYISLSLSKLHYIPYYSSYTSLYHYICFNSRFWCGTPTYISISSIRSRLGAGFHDLPSSGLDCMPRADAQFSEKWPPSLGKSGKTRGKVHQWTGKKNLEFMICFLSWGSCHWASLPNITYVYLYIYIHTHYLFLRSIIF